MNLSPRGSVENKPNLGKDALWPHDYDVCLFPYSRGYLNVIATSTLSTCGIIHN